VIAPPFRLMLRIPVPWVFVLAYVVGIVVESMAGHRPIESARWLGVAGAVLLALGVAIAGWGLVSFRRARTTTIPGQASSQLVTWGPYRFTRNPMYIGLTMAYLGEAGVLHQVWPLVLLPLVLAYVNWVVIPLEERTLTEVFGGAYNGYCTRVRRWI
jgi:protein-S-isoprenylcysteine O-methyltransferase Ste14